MFSVDKFLPAILFVGVEKRLGKMTRETRHPRRRDGSNAHTGVLFVRVI